MIELRLLVSFISFIKGKNFLAIKLAFTLICLKSFNIWEKLVFKILPLKKKK